MNIGKNVANKNDKKSKDCVINVGKLLTGNKIPIKIMNNLYIGKYNPSKIIIWPIRKSGISEYNGKVPKMIVMSSLKNKISPKDTKTWSK